MAFDGPGSGWAVGWTEDGNLEAQSLVLHRDGSSWTVSRTPTLNGPNEFTGVAPTASTDVFASGYIGVQNAPTHVLSARFSC